MYCVNENCIFWTDNCECNFTECAFEEIDDSVEGY